MHPGAWIVWAACAGWVAFSTTNPFYLVVLLGAAWIVHASHRREGPASRSFRVFLLFGLWAMGTRTALVFLGTVEASSVTLALFEGFRLGVLLAVFGTFNSVTDPFGILRFAPRRFHEPALASALALSLAPRTIAATAKVREAQRLRGFRGRRWRMLPSLAVPVLENGMEAALTLAESMDARGHGSGPRTRYRPQAWGPGSWVVASTASLGAVAFLGAVIEHSGGLSPSTFPLEWPEVSSVLLIAVALLAVPALVSDGNDS